MASVRPRENTFKVLLSNFPKRPSFEDLHLFVHDTLGLRLDQILRLQMNHAQNCVHVKCIDLTTAQDTVILHDGRHELEVNKKKYKVRLQMDDGGVEIKVHDVSENVTKEELFTALKQYGDIMSARELAWNESFACKGIPSGVWVVKMNLRRHIKSFINIQGEQSLVTYRNQPQTCRHCSNLVHIGSTCVENRKLLGQKADLDSRLKRAQASNGPSSNSQATNSSTAPMSFATVLNNATTLLPTPHFARGNTLHTQTLQNISGPSTTLSTNNEVLPVTTLLDADEMQKDHEMEQSGIEKSPTIATTPKQMEPMVTGAHSSDCEIVGSADAVFVDAAVAVAGMAGVMNKSSGDHITHSTVETQRNDEGVKSSCVSAFKTPTNPVLSNSLTMEISESESNESSTECTSFQKVKRGRGRPKKHKLDSSVSNSNVAE